MGIVNVTPDSFSDGGKFLDADAAVRHGLKLVGQGAEILDIGGESTRPGAKPVSEKEELRRVIPVIENLTKILSKPGRDALPRVRADRQVSPTKPVLISIDTMKPAVARAALAAGASIVNDVAANRSNDEMWQVVSEFRAGYVCMHAQGTPQTMQRNPRYKNVVREVREFFQERLKSLKAHGVAPEQVVLDPGIGFGKTTEHNLHCSRTWAALQRCGGRCCWGFPGNRFIGKLFGRGGK